MISLNTTKKTYLMLFACTAFLSGCSKGEVVEYHQVSGQITYQDKPLVYGTVIFEPDAQAGNAGAQGFAEVENGFYDTSRNGRGVLGGAYKIYISGQAEKGDPEKGVIPPQLFRDFLVKIDIPKGPSVQNFKVLPDAKK